MVLIILVCAFCYIVTTNLIFLYQKSGKKNIIFHFDRYVFFDKKIEKASESVFAKVLADIILKKIFYNKPQNYNFISLQTFKSMYIQDAPVYVLDFKNIHKDMWVIYETAISILQKKINLVIKNKLSLPMTKIGEFVFCYILDENVSYDKLALFNALNVNYDYKKNMLNLMQLDNCEELKGNYEYSKNTLVFNYEKTKNKYVKIIFPDETFGYKVQKNKKDIILSDIFAHKKFVIKNLQNINIYQNIVLINTKSSPTLSVCDSEILNKLKLIYAYKIIGKSNVFVMLNYLKNLAINHINKNLLTDIELIADIDNNFFSNQINKIGIKEFIQLANLYKDYCSRYYFILEKIFGLKYFKNKIFCSPNTDYISENFSLTFVNYKVKSLQYINKQTEQNKTSKNNVKIQNTGFDERQNIDRYFIEYH